MKIKMGKFQWVLVAVLTGAVAIVALTFTHNPASNFGNSLTISQTNNKNIQQAEQTELKQEHIIQGNNFEVTAKNDLNEVKKLRTAGKIDQLFGKETQELSQDVMNSAHRVSYFQARRALIEDLKSEKNASKLKKIILDYDTSNKEAAQVPTIVHFSFIALGELSKEQGLSQAADVYKGIADRLSNLENQKSSDKIKAARLTDVYDLTRNILKNQISSRSADWPEIVEVLEQLKIRDNFLNHHMKNELKNAVASVVDLEDLSNLDKLHETLDEWWNSNQ